VGPGQHSGPLISIPGQMVEKSISSKESTVNKSIIMHFMSVEHVLYPVKPRLEELTRPIAMSRLRIMLAVVAMQRVGIHMEMI
jgi:hypothetical protein